MSMLMVVQVVALLSSGLKAGVLFGDRMGVHFARPALSPSSFVKFQQAQLLHWERIMPAISSIAAIASIAWLVLIWSQIGSVGFALVLVAALASISSLVLAAVGCLPVNKQLMTWSVSSPPPDVMTTWRRWEQVNGIRTLLAIVGFSCVIMALFASGSAAGQGT